MEGGRERARERGRNGRIEVGFEVEVGVGVGVKQSIWCANRLPKGRLHRFHLEVLPYLSLSFALVFYQLHLLGGGRERDGERPDSMAGPGCCCAWHMDCSRCASTQGTGHPRARGAEIEAAPGQQRAADPSLSAICTISDAAFYGFAVDTARSPVK